MLKLARDSNIHPGHLCQPVSARQAMSADEPKVMKTEFRELRLKERLPVQLVDYPEQENILDAADSAFYCDNRQQIMELLIDRVPETRNQRKYLVTLAKIHEGASARNTVEAKRKAEGWEDISSSSRITTGAPTNRSSSGTTFSDASNARRITMHTHTHRHKESGLGPRAWEVARCQILLDWWRADCIVYGIHGLRQANQSLRITL